jgi:hypothetical protein
MVHDQAIVISENIAIRALTGTVKRSRESIARSDAALRISQVVLTGAPQSPPFPCVALHSTATRACMAR